MPHTFPFRTRVYPDGLETMPLLIVDGKPVTWVELGRMVCPYMGFRFKLEIFDRSEER